MNNYDLIITTNKLKEDILKKASKDKLILKSKILTYNDFKNKLFGTCDNNALLFFMKKYNFSYNKSKIYLNNIFLSPNLKIYLDDLQKNNLIINDSFFINSFNSILFINVFNVDKYILEKLKNKQVNYNFLENKYNHEVYEFENYDDEINYVATKILDLLKNNININDIKLINLSNLNLLKLERIFNLYNIPINLKEEKSIFKTKDVINFINSLKKEKDINKSLNLIKNIDYKNKIINILNKYNFKEITDIEINLIIKEISYIKIKTKKIKNAIELIGYDDIFDDDKYYFIIAFNDGNMPHIYKDNDLIKDSEKEALGILTSNEKIKIEKESFIKIINNTKNIYLSYSKEENPSTIIRDYNMKIVRDNTFNYNYSHKINYLALAISIDNLIKYNSLNENINLLYSNYPNINYNIYNNNYTKINIDSYNKYINKGLVLSYTSLNNYFNCKYKYYLENILKINKYEETLALKIGNLFHDVLSKIYDENFNFEKSYNEYYNSLNLTNKEKFFLTNLKKELLFIINTIFEFEKSSSLINSMTEQSVLIKEDENVSIYGKIDKIKYLEKDDKTYLLIVDYKTGTIASSIDNLCYGLNMQLPMYLYLAKNMNLKNVVIGGFYLQKILNNPKVDDEDRKKSLMYEGFTNSCEDITSLVDENYENSKIIKSLKKGPNGFYAYSKILSNEMIDKIYNITDKNIHIAKKEILDADFEINPKRINNELISCIYCKYKDICNKKEENIKDLPYQKIMDILKEDKN